MLFDKIEFGLLEQTLWDGLSCRMSNVYLPKCQINQWHPSLIFSSLVYSLTLTKFPSIKSEFNPFHRDELDIRFGQKAKRNSPNASMPHSHPTNLECSQVSNTCPASDVKGYEYPFITTLAHIYIRLHRKRIKKNKNIKWNIFIKWYSSFPHYKKIKDMYDIFS